MTEYQDTDLVVKIKEDNQSAFEVIFVRYYATLCKYASSILGDADASEEIVQDLFVKFWENRFHIEINTSLKAYLFRTVHNLCLNQIDNWRVRKEYSLKQTREIEINEKSITPFTTEYPIANLIVKELEQKIQESIAALPEQCREIFLLIRMQNKSYQETADKLNISLNTVKTQMQRAVVKMKDMLQEYLPVFLLILFNYIA